MTPQFSKAVDPIFLHVLGLLERISQDENPSPQEERLRIRAYLDQGEAFIGASEEWNLAKYALTSWIDEVLLEAPWHGRDWWNNNVLEVELFNTRLCNELFYTKAQEASTLSSRNALEVYYVCVVLGFRGFYRDPQAASLLAGPRGLPNDLETWARQIAWTIRLGQGLPDLREGAEDGEGAPPLEGKSVLMISFLVFIMLGTVTSILGAIYFLS
ncbi:Type IV secretion protein DotU [Planctomycetales bacterium 10988]|nr:Type IV secretion protein DotU [Planctomycetales bacterium 10988]